MLAIAAQLALPGIAADRIEDRLTRDGGAARAEVSSFPALKLLFGDGERLKVSGRGLDLDISEVRETPFERLRGFDDVDIELQDSRAGPMEIERFDLTRHDGDDVYAFQLLGMVSPDSISDFGGSFFGGALAAELGRRLLEGAGVPAIPIDFDLRLKAGDREVSIVGGDAKVAGFDAGLLAQIVVTAVALRI